MKYLCFATLNSAPFEVVICQTICIIYVQCPKRPFIVMSKAILYIHNLGMSKAILHIHNRAPSSFTTLVVVATWMSHTWSNHSAESSYCVIDIVYNICINHITNESLSLTIYILLIKVARVVGHSVFCHIPVLSFSFCQHSHSLFYVSFSFFVLSFSFLLPAKTIPILILPYSPRLAKIKKNMSSRGFELVTSQAKAKSRYRYTTCMFMSTSMTRNTSTTSLTKLTCYPCIMRNSR
jgi:hypothetical protein